MIFPLISCSPSSNSYIIVDDKKSLIIDPGISTKNLTKKIEEIEINPEIIILTHCHYDHVAKTLEIKNLTNAKILAHEFCAKVIEAGNDTYIHAKVFVALPVKIEVDKKLRDGDILKLDKMNLEIIHTPGHSPGSICLYEEKTKSLFSGDTIFANAVGRADLPGGNWSDLKKSIEKLIELHETRGIEKIYPGHGPISSGEDMEKVYELYF